MIWRFASARLRAMITTSHKKFPPPPPPVSSSNGSSWPAELAHGIPESNHQLEYSWSKDEKLNFAHENQFGRSLCNAQLQPKRWDITMQADHSEYGGARPPPGGLKAFPTSLFPLQRGENVIQAKDDIQVLKERQLGGMGRAFTRKSQSGPHGYLPLLLQGAGKCPPTFKGRVGSGKSSG